MMTKFMLAAAIAALGVAPITAQSTFPTRAPGVRVGGVVQMTCDANGANCAPVAGDASGSFISANQYWTDSSAALAASATFTGTLRANGGAAGAAGSRFAFFLASAFSDVAGGTLFIDMTVDGGSTYRQVGSVALVAGSTATLKVPVSAAGYRVRVVNGGTAQGAALITTAYSLN